MKLQFPSPSLSSGAFRAANEGFTLPELLIASTVFTMVVSGVLFANLFGLNMFRITETKLIATDAARKTTGKITDEVQTCKSTWIGNVKNGVFEALLDGETQQGSGLLIYPTTNKANFVIYFVNPSDQTFRRTTSTPDSAIVLAESVTNKVVFRAQDYLGNVLTNNQNNRVIHLNLEFYQPQRYMQVADYYKLETSVTRRALE
jgi:prepilin-type N-terminal cleavage/methylation domain-containing protein